MTFHRAIDVTPDPVEALHACARCGVHRVLTSGGQPTAVQGAPTVRRLVDAVAAAHYPMVVAATLTLTLRLSVSLALRLTLSLNEA